MLEQIDLAKIPMFLAVAQRLNFTEAANDLYMSQPALSKAISALEASFGFALFKRSNRKLTLTTEGEYLYRECTQICMQLDKAVMNAKSMKDGKTGHFSVATPGYLAHTPMFKHLSAQFAIRSPFYDMEMIHVDYSEVRKILMDGTADAILINQHDLSVLHGFCMLPISTGGAVALYNPRVPIPRKGAEPTLEDLKDRRFIAVDSAQAASYLGYLVDTCKAYGFAPQITRYTDSIVELIDCIGNSDYVTVMDRSILPIEYDLKSIAIPQKEGTPEPLQTVLAWKKESQNPALLEYISYAEEQLGTKAKAI